MDPETFRDPALHKHFHEKMFTDFDFDATMLHIAAMNMVLHGVEGANIHHRDSLSEDHADDADNYSVVLDHLTARGVMDPAHLYESPFTDMNALGAEGVLGKARTAEVIEILREVRARAAA